MKRKKAKDKSLIRSTLKNLQKRLKSEPENITYLFEMGKLCDELGDMDGAKGCYSKVVELAPNSMYAKASSDRLCEMFEMDDKEKGKSKGKSIK